MFGSGLKAEFWRFLCILGIALVIGLVSHRTALALLVVLGAYTCWLLLKIRQLQRWVNRLRLGSPPDKSSLAGLWADIGYDLQLLQNKHDKEKQRLQAVVKRVQDMTTALTDGVVLIDPRGNMEWWNRVAERMFDFREIDRGHKLINLIRHPKFVQYFDDAEYSTPLELAMWQRNQHLEFQVHVFGEGERLVIARDITRVYKLEQMRKDFVANVSHELRTPLTVIQGYVETLSDAHNVPPSWQKALGQMSQQCARMTALINDLLTLTKLETAQKEVHQKPVALGPLLEGILADARALSGDKNHMLTLHGNALACVVGSEAELRSAISNLVVNAINYSPPATHIDVTLNSSPTETVVSVKDAGIGIDPKHLSRITERFYRVDQGRSVASGGTGLGLAIVKHVLLRHNAELRIKSELGKGSEFSCHFPVNTGR